MKVRLLRSQGMCTPPEKVYFLSRFLEEDDDNDHDYLASKTASESKVTGLIELDLTFVYVSP